MPVHQLLLRHHVTAVFKAHDNFFARQQLDGIVYQMIPQPSFAGDDRIRDLQNYGYKHGTFLGNSGHVRVTVSPEQVKVDYVPRLHARRRDGSAQKRRARGQLRDQVERSNTMKQMTGIMLLLLCVLCALGALAQEQAPPPSDDGNAPRQEQQRGGGQYTLEQAISDRAQLTTIAFSGLAFITGDFGASTFLPPGKACDFFGFQYMRDVDVAGQGHNPKFLNRVAGNVFTCLNDEQKQQFQALATEQTPQFRTLALLRFPLIKAFCRQLNGEIPAGSAGLEQGNGRANMSATSSPATPK